MMERVLRGMAGFVVLVSLGLAQVHSPNWLYVTAFMGLNLLQSAFTNWCPMMPILRAMGIDKNK
ncbi:MAG: rhodanese [Nitrospirae bacterium CG22_combo_CG10-13_8_21_14_all_44_11]